MTNQELEQKVKELTEQVELQTKQLEKTKTDADNYRKWWQDEQVATLQLREKLAAIKSMIAVV